MMHSQTQFTRNADGFFLEVQYANHSLNFLLVSNNEDLFYELRLTNATLPSVIRKILPTTSHFYLYLLKNHQHPKGFRIGPDAQIYITIPMPNDLPVELVLPTNRITKESIMPYDDLLFSEVEQVRPNKSKPEETESLPFGKKQKRRETQCLDLQNTDQTPRSDIVSTGCEMSEVLNEQKDRAICRQVERLLGQGCQMRTIRSKLKLRDRTALKMYQQFQRFKRVFSPQEGRRIKQNERARKLISRFLQGNREATLQCLREQLLRSGIKRELEFIGRVRARLQVVFYSDESGSAMQAQSLSG